MVRTFLYSPKLVEGETVRELMESLFKNLVEFVEHFMGFAMLPKLTKVGLHYKKPEDPIKQRWSLVPKSFLDAIDGAKPMGLEG